jgi:hypothetical protein
LSSAAADRAALVAAALASRQLLAAAREAHTVRLYSFVTKRWTHLVPIKVVKLRPARPRKVVDGDRRSKDLYKLFNLRLPVATMTRIRGYRAYLSETQPGLEPTMSSVVRILLHRGLVDVEPLMAIPGKRRGDD